MASSRSRALPITVQDVQNVVKTKLNYTLTEDQAIVIDKLIEGNDVVAVLPTGTGKSLIFMGIFMALEAGKHEYMALIVTPLLSLTQSHARSFEQVGLKSIDLNTNPQADGNIIFSNPEALTDPKAMKILKDNKSTHKFVIVDEAHIVKFWGEGDDKLKKAFRGAFKRLAESISVMMPRPAVLCLTATMMRETKVAVKAIIGVTNVFSIERCPVNPNITYWSKTGNMDYTRLSKLVASDECPRILIFDTRKDIGGKTYKKIQHGLSVELQHRVLSINGDTSKSIQTQVIDALMDRLSSVRVVVATSVLAMGVDISGRVGRVAGKTAISIVATRKPATVQGRTTYAKWYMNNIEKKCRRKLLGDIFDQGSPLDYNNKADNGCCDICCEPSLSDPVLSLIGEQLKMPLFTSDSPKRKVLGIEKKEFAQTLREISRNHQRRKWAYDQHGGRILTNHAIIDLDLNMQQELTDNLKYLMTPDDLTKLCPDINKEIKARVWNSISVHFPKENLEEMEWPYSSDSKSKKRKL